MFEFYYSFNRFLPVKNINHSDTHTHLNARTYTRSLITTTTTTTSATQTRGQIINYTTLGVEQPNQSHAKVKVNLQLYRHPWKLENSEFEKTIVVSLIMMVVVSCFFVFIISINFTLKQFVISVWGWEDDE